VIHLRYQLERVAQQIVNICFMTIPRPRPSHQALLEGKIVSHRGEHDNLQVKENTMVAFARVVEAGAWGIEFDVRWTRDLEPVVIHDTDTRRVFDVELVVAEASLTELRQRVPEIPTLAEVVKRFGGVCHLMVELKRDELGAEESRTERLQEIFASLTPGTDYHFLALQFDLFDLVKFAGGDACLPVAELKTRNFSRATLASDLAGVCGHYLLLNRDMIKHHHRQGQKVGTGFIASRFSLYRELNRGVDWIFTNHALRLTAIRQQLLRRE
jgi:glycerophosphoryl diester phosphodiesterase